jgi:hypothetical protein
VGVASDEPRIGRKPGPDKRHVLRVRPRFCKA